MYRCRECGSVHETCSKRIVDDDIGIEWFCPDCNGDEIEEVVECCGEDCSILIDEDDYFCVNCEKNLQKRISEFLADFNEEEKEYMIKYIYERYYR